MSVLVSVAIFIMMFFSKIIRRKYFDDAAEMLETVGPLSTPMLLACLGAVLLALVLVRLFQKG